jgi:hypothetical protein
MASNHGYCMGVFPRHVTNHVTFTRSHLYTVPCPSVSPNQGFGQKSFKSAKCLFCREVKVKGKVVAVLPLTEHHAMKAYWGSEGTASPIL